MQQLIFFLLLILKINLLSANVIWPALFVSEAIWSSSFIIIISLIIEAFLFYLLIKPKITFNNAIFMSIFGNMASNFIGVFLSLFPAIFMPGFITTSIFMYFVSCIIEFYAIKIIFVFSDEQINWKRLKYPILIGNFITYALAGISLYTGYASFKF